MSVTIRSLTPDLWSALEAYPLDADKTPSTSFTGYASTFARPGFKTIARHMLPRPIKRHDLI